MTSDGMDDGRKEEPSTQKQKPHVSTDKAAADKAARKGVADKGLGWGHVGKAQRLFLAFRNEPLSGLGTLTALENSQE